MVSNKALARAPLLCSQRLNLAFIGFLGLVVVYSLRVNLSVAIVCMINKTAVAEQFASARVVEGAKNLDSSNIAVKKPDSSNDQCIRMNSTEASRYEGSLTWSKEEQGDLLGAFFWGYPFSQVLGGWLASKFGAKLIIGLSVSGGAILTLLSPSVANLSFYAFYSIRILLGFFQGVTFPAFHSMWSHWAPPLERSLLIGINYAGGQVGNMLTLPVASLLCKYGFGGGWPSIFYILGIVGILWVLLWYFFMSSTPEGHSHISDQEKEYIESSLANEMTKGTKQPPIPWSSILRSRPFWACVIGHFAGDWGAYTMFTSMPMYLNDVLKFDLTSLGFIASIPYIAYFVCINLGGFLTDFVRKRNYMNTLNARRAAMIIALGSQALFLVLLGYTRCGQEILAIVLLTLGVGLSGFQYAGFVVNYMDIAPAFSGSLLGVGNTLSCVAGYLSPKLMGMLTPDGTAEQWQIVYWLTAAILLIGTSIFVLFASGDVQSWAIVDDENSQKELNPLRNSVLTHYNKQTAEGDVEFPVA